MIENQFFRIYYCYIFYHLTIIAQLFMNTPLITQICPPLKGTQDKDFPQNIMLIFIDIIAFEEQRIMKLIFL